MNSNYKITYNVDMVFCIDATGSMAGLINTVLENALNFYQDVIDTMKKKNKEISSLRVKVIAFRDYLADKDDAMKTTDFFSLPGDAEEFRKCISMIVADGGGDIPEDGLEAVGYAIRSDWDKQGAKRRHVIAVWTDAPTHELGHGRSAGNYPENMAEDFSVLTEWWGDSQNPGYMDQHAKRMILFAPNEPYWKNISDSWDNVMHYPSSKAGGDVNKVLYSQIIDAISSTI